MDKIVVRITLNGENYTLPSCGAFLQYDEKDVELDYTIPIFEPIYSSHLPLSYIPTDAPTGVYKLVVTDAEYGYTWTFENFLEITEKPDAQRFGFYHDMGEKLTVSRSSGEVYTFTVIVENRGDPFTVTESPTSGFLPDAYLYRWDESEDGGKGLALHVKWPIHEEHERTVSTGETGSLSHEIRVNSDDRCGLYNLIVSYGDCVQIFEDVVEVVP